MAKHETEAGTGWTAERVERLTALWAEGLSASQIATQLGGVSRNAVIGKVHRLKLSGRATQHNKPAQPRVPKSDPGSTVRAQPFAPVLKYRGNLAQAPAAEAQVEEAPQQLNADIVRFERPCTLVELTARTCRFPIGDPLSESFRFCGAPVAPGLPYCGPCARKAYQQRDVKTAGERRGGSRVYGRDFR